MQSITDFSLLVDFTSVMVHILLILSNDSCIEPFVINRCTVRISGYKVEMY